jgi:hypothetical protein
MNLGRLVAMGLVSVLVSCSIGYAWLRANPSPRLVRVDVGSLFEEQKKTLAAKLKPGMSEVEQRAIFLAAADYGKQVDEALSTVANECRCGVLNTAALVRLPDATETGISDATDRVRQLLAQK